MTFREMVEARDLDALPGLLADDVVLHSPVTFRPFEGRDAVAFVLGKVAQVFEDFRYVAEMERDGLTTLVFEARVGDRSVQGVDLVRVREDGLIDDITVLVRPLSGLQALAEEMGRRLGAA